MHPGNRIAAIAPKGWLPDLDLNQDKQIQSLLCYRYTIGQTDAIPSVRLWPLPSSRRTSSPRARPNP